MPVEPPESIASDDFENDLGTALRRAADTFAPEDPLTLVSDGHFKGRRMRRRRTATAVAGATALVALVAGGVTAGTGVFGGGTGARQSGVAAAPRLEVSPASGRHYDMTIAAMLRSKVPADVRLQFSRDGNGDYGASAAVSKGSSKIRNLLQVGVERSDRHGSMFYACRQKTDGRYGFCVLPRDKTGALPLTWGGKGAGEKVVGTRTTVHGGTLTTYRTVAKPGQPARTVLVIYDIHGYEVHLNESPDWDGDVAPRSFHNMLTDTQLASIVTDKTWAKIAKSLPRQPKGAPSANGAKSGALATRPEPGR